MLCCVALRCAVLRCVALRCVSLRCVALCCAVLRCVALRCVALRCVALRCVNNSPSLNLLLWERLNFFAGLSMLSMLVGVSDTDRQFGCMPFKFPTDIDETICADARLAFEGRVHGGPEMV